MYIQANIMTQVVREQDAHGLCRVSDVLIQHETGLVRFQKDQIQAA